MIPHDAAYTPAMAQRYRRLAGPFCAESEPLLRGMEAYMKATGARCVTLAEREGVCLWRLASECETLQETARRLTKYQLTKTNTKITNNNRP